LKQYKFHEKAKVDTARPGIETFCTEGFGKFFLPADPACRKKTNLKILRYLKRTLQFDKFFEDFHYLVSSWVLFRDTVILD